MFTYYCSYSSNQRTRPHWLRKRLGLGRSRDGRVGEASSPGFPKHQIYLSIYDFFLSVFGLSVGICLTCRVVRQRVICALGFGRQRLSLRARLPLVFLAPRRLGFRLESNGRNAGQRGLWPAAAYVSLLPGHLFCCSALSY